MPIERSSFTDRVQSAQQNINNGYQNESQRKAMEAQRDLTDLGVVSAFQEVINNRTITVEYDSDKPVHIESGSASVFDGYFLVFMDQTRTVPDRCQSDWPQYYTSVNKQAIGVLKTGVGYQVGFYNKNSIHDVRWRSKNDTTVYSEDTGTKMILQRNQVLDELATVVAIFSHNQKEKKRGSSNFLKYP